jgi:hypothetical protein
LEALGTKGCLVLFQLPPNFSADQARLAAFIQMLPNTRRYAFEFRHRSWYHDGIMELLQSRNAALCISDHGMHRHLGRRQPTMSTSADMVLAAAIVEGTAVKPWLGGYGRSIVGSANVARFSFILTMIKRRLRQRMRTA